MCDFSYRKAPAQTFYWAGAVLIDNCFYLKLIPYPTNENNLDYPLPPDVLNGYAATIWNSVAVLIRDCTGNGCITFLYTVNVAVVVNSDYASIWTRVRYSIFNVVRIGYRRHYGYRIFIIHFHCVCYINVNRSQLWYLSSFSFITTRTVMSFYPFF